MAGLTVHGIDDNGFDDPSLDLQLECNSRATLENIRNLISRKVYASDTPEIIQLIKCSEEHGEVLEEDLSKTLDDVLEDKDSLYFYIEPFAREAVTITLKVTEAAMEWINANTKNEIKLLVGTSKDFIVIIS